MSTTLQVGPLEENALFDFEDLIPDMNKELSDADMPEMEKFGLVPERAAVAYIAQKGENGGSNFIRDLWTKLSTGGALTMRQTRVVLNIVREEKLGIKGRRGVPATVDPDFDGAYKCRECGQAADNFAELVEHRINAHDFQPAWGSKEQAVVNPVAVLAGAPDTGLDLSNLPDGYYGVPLPNSTKTSTWTFLRVQRTRKNKTFRNRRYRTGKVITGAEFVPAGTIEVAEMSSNAQRLSGEQIGSQTPGENSYKGEFKEHLEMLVQRPEMFAKFFASQIGRCARCGKILTDDTSRDDCFGPECVNKVSDHFYSEWSGRFTEKARETCPMHGCKKTDGKPVEGVADTFECSSGHQWHFRPRR